MPGNIGTGEHMVRGTSVPGNIGTGEHRYRGTSVPGNIGSGNIGTGDIGTGEHSADPDMTTVLSVHTLPLAI